MTATILGGPRIGSRRRAPVLDPDPSPWLVPVAAAVAVLPIVVATVRGLLNGWLAVGDNANFLLRSRDVLTSNHPLLGTWSSASLAVGEDVNHPGPLLFDLLAVPAKLGGSGGLAVGVALVGIASVAGIAVFAGRVGGARLALAALVAAAALEWTIGSSLLFDPWNPHVVLAPFLFLLVLVLGMAAGDTLALPFAAAVASVVVQTHLTYAVLAPALCLVGVVLLVHKRRSDVLRAAVAASVVLVACWLQPVVDQVAGEGNLGALASGVGSSDDTVGASLGLRVAAEVVSTPPWWARPSFAESFRVPPLQPTHIAGEPNLAGLPSTATAVLSLLAVAALGAGAWLFARRRGDRVATTTIGVGAVSVAVAVVAVVTQPMSGVGLTGHQLRYLWPASIVLSVGIALAFVPRRWALPAPLIALAVLTVANLPATRADIGPANDADVFPVVRELAAQLGDLDVDGPLLYDTDDLRFAEPWTPAIIAALVDHGVDVEVDGEFWVRQLGDGRAASGEARQRIYLREAGDAEAIPAGARRVAFVEGLSIDDQRELARLQRALADIEVRLSDIGRAAHALDPLPYFRDPELDVAGLVDSGWLAAFVEAGAVEVADDVAAPVQRYTDLWNRWRRHTVALFVEPID